jgi:enterochelin esterase-like enzyme
MSPRLIRALPLPVLLLALDTLTLAQSAAPKGTTERISIQSKALEGNLAGDSATREVSVYLPPSYAQSRNRRYPVVYLLHGFTDSDAKWFGLDGKHWIHLPTVLDKANGNADVKEVIVVMPNAFNTFQGSAYSSSVTVGDWERFITEELVAFIDKRYRTLAAPASRGLAGHSMGGYGTLRLGMKYPRVFSSIYALSPCCLAPMSGSGSAEGKPSPAEAVKAKEEIAKADFGTKAQLAGAAAWSPNPEAPPLFLDLPTKDGKPVPGVAARFAANAPLAMLHQYIFNLRSLKAIGFDAGTRDTNIHATCVELDRMLNAYTLAHAWESYEGDHLNRIAERIEKVMLPFFTRNLTF